MPRFPRPGSGLVKPGLHSAIGKQAQKRLKHSINSAQRARLDEPLLNDIDPRVIAAHIERQHPEIRIKLAFLRDSSGHRQWINAGEPLLEYPVDRRLIEQCTGGWRKQRYRTVQMIDFDPDLASYRI